MARNSSSPLSLLRKLDQPPLLALALFDFISLLTIDFLQMA
jgi:hypothetical protein